MSQSVNIIRNKTIGGMVIASSYTVTGDGVITQNATIPMGQAGQLSTRSSDTAGIITLDAVGAMPASGVGDLYHSSGNVYQCVYTRTSTALTIASVGSGVLPTNLEDVVFCDTIQVDAAFSGTNMDFFSTLLDQAGHVAFCVTGGTSQLDADLVANQDYGWDNTEVSVTNPVTGDDIVYLLVSTSSVTADATFKCGVLYDSTS